MNKIILSARDWRIYRALWLLMVMALVVDLCAVLMESDLLTTTAATLTAVETSDWLSFSSEAVCFLASSQWSRSAYSLAQWLSGGFRRNPGLCHYFQAPNPSFWPFVA